MYTTRNETKGAFHLSGLTSQIGEFESRILLLLRIRDKQKEKGPFYNQNHRNSSPILVSRSGKRPKNELWMKQPYFSSKNLFYNPIYKKQKQNQASTSKNIVRGEKTEEYCSLNKGSNRRSTTHAGFSHSIRCNPEIHLAEKLSHCTALAC